MKVNWRLIGTRLLQGLKFFAPLIVGKLDLKVQKYRSQDQDGKAVMLEALQYMLQRINDLEDRNLTREEKRVQAIGSLQQHPVLSGLSYSESNALIEAGIQSIRSYKDANELASATAQAFEMLAEASQAASDLIKYGES